MSPLKVFERNPLMLFLELGRKKNTQRHRRYSRRGLWMVYTGGSFQSAWPISTGL
jgi:hypothetical protein